MVSKQNRTAQAIRNVELALPAAIAHRLAGIFIPTSDEDREFLAHACTVFNAVTMEPVETLPLAKRESHRRSVLKLRAELLDQYEGRGAVTVYSAAHKWLGDLIKRGVLESNPQGAFAICWDALDASFENERKNVEAWNKCQRSAEKMAAEWRAWLEKRGYYQMNRSIAA